MNHKEGDPNQASSDARNGQRGPREQWSFYAPGGSGQQVPNHEQSPAVMSNEEMVEYELHATNAARMWQALRSGDATAIRDLVERGVDINEGDNEDLTPLHYSASQGQLAMTEQLLDCGANVNAKDLYGYTALILAARSGQADVVRLLLARGADPNVEADDNAPEEPKSKTTALKTAILYKQPEIVELLRKHGALR